MQPCPMHGAMPQCMQPCPNAVSLVAPTTCRHSPHRILGLREVLLRRDGGMEEGAVDPRGDIPRCGHDVRGIPPTLVLNDAVLARGEAEARFLCRLCGEVLPDALNRRSARECRVMYRRRVPIQVRACVRLLPCSSVGATNEAWAVFPIARKSSSW
eukprot:Polyplicarium_translucidae@DN2923_c1_g1_i5.p2